jgi:hypothetical protein
MVDIAPSQIREYIDKFKPEQREYIATLICDGEAFVNAFNVPEIKIITDVLSEQCHMEFDKMMALIKEGKYIEHEELRRIRQHCIGVNKIFEIIAVWKTKLDQFDRHLEKL